MGAEGKPANALVVMLAILGGALLLCAGLAALGVGSSMYISVTEKDDVKAALDIYMQRMSAKDAGGAYALFSSRARRQMPASQLETGLHPPNYSIYEGYLSLEVDSMNVQQSVNTSPDVPQGTLATVQGRITYADGFNGNFQSLLEKEGGRWMLDRIDIVVPPDKISKSTSKP